MFIELVEWLRCVREHEPTWLVASTDVLEARDIIRGTLGCPVCRATYPIVAGTADFRTEPERRPARGGRRTDPIPLHGDPGRPSSAEELLRLTALLGITEPGGFVLLAGTWAGLARPMAAASDVQVVTLNAVPAAESGRGVSPACSDDLIPLRVSSCRGIALDHDHALPRTLNSAAAALRPGARLVAPGTTALPEGVRELARDDRHWVAERETPPGPVLRLERRRY